MYYVAAPSYKRAHIAKHYIFNTGNGDWIPTIMLLQFQP
jgi:hypothetical protein